jgi:hypothetical protein
MTALPSGGTTATPGRQAACGLGNVVLTGSVPSRDNAWVSLRLLSRAAMNPRQLARCGFNRRQSPSHGNRGGNHGSASALGGSPGKAPSPSAADCSIIRVTFDRLP